MSAADEIPLTWLYVPGDRPERFGKAVASEADVVIIDLEDAVAPARKDEARTNAVAFLASAPAKPVTVRVNDVRSSWGAADLTALARAPHASGVRVPKVESADDVRAVARYLGRDVPLHCLIESAKGIEAVSDIATAPHVASIGLGEADLRAELGVADEDGLLWARGRVVIAARAAGLPPPAMSVYAKLDDPDGLAASCRRGRALGFLGRAAIHPQQLAVITASFLPSNAETDAARRLIAMMGSATDAGRGAVALPDGRFADRAMVESARRVLALAARRRVGESS